MCRPHLVILIALVCSGCLPVDIVTTSVDIAGMLSEALSVPPDRTPSATSDQLELAWTHDGPIVTRSSKMLAAKGVLIFTEYRSPYSNLIALHSEDGSPASTIRYPLLAGRVMRIASSEELIFLGTDFGTVVAIDPDSLKDRWWTLLEFPGRIDELSYADGLLFADTSHIRNFVLDPSTGEVVSDQLPYGTYAWSRTSGTTITDGVYALSLYDSSRLWETPIKGGVYGVPLFTEGRIVVRGGREAGNAYILDRSTGDVVSVSSVPVVSNLALSATRSFGITQDGSLRSWELDTGRETTLARFGSSPIDLYGDNQAGYFVAVDTSSNTLCAYLGDAAQVFAFTLSSGG